MFLRFSDKTFSLLILFEGIVTGGALEARDDAARAVFLAPDELPLDQLAFDSTRLLLARWLEERGD